LWIAPVSFALPLLMQPPFDIPADLDTPVSAFRKLKAFEPTFLLESAEGGERLGRYSFIGLGRAVTVRLDDRGLGINGENRLAVTTVPELCAELQRACERAPALLPAGAAPFAGGLVGMVGYDFVRRLERLPSPARSVHRTGAGAPDRPDAAADALFVAPRSLVVFDHLTRRIALLHGGPEWERQSLRREVIAALRGPMPPPPARSGHEPATASLDEAAFVDRVGRVKEHILAGDVFQLVLSIRFEGRCHTDPFEVYRALRLLNPSPYLFYLDLGETQLVGSSPEALVKLERGIATLRPIAGTRKRGATDEEDRALAAELLADPKEAAEHVMLVDLARNDLGRVARPGTIKVEPFRSVERYSHVMHLVSGVRGELEAGRGGLDLFCAAFPAGTVSGAPKVRAMQIIDELETVRRGFYAGTVGYFSRSGEMDHAIAIRTIEFRGGRYAYQAGAGIVADSDPHAEYREVRSKVGVLEAALALAAEGL